MSSRSSYLAHGIQRAAQRTDIPLQELKKLIKSGDLTPVIIGNKLLLREHDLQDLLRRHRVEPGKEDVLIEE